MESLLAPVASTSFFLGGYMTHDEKIWCCREVKSMYAYSQPPPLNCPFPPRWSVLLWLFLHQNFFILKESYAFRILDQRVSYSSGKPYWLIPSLLLLLLLLSFPSFLFNRKIYISRRHAQVAPLCKPPGSGSPEKWTPFLPIAKKKKKKGSWRLV